MKNEPSSADGGAGWTFLPFYFVSPERLHENGSPFFGGKFACAAKVTLGGIGFCCAVVYFATFTVLEWMIV